MIVVDWMAVTLGLAIGAVVSSAFFWGLGFGMRLALRTEQPVRILVLSAFARITSMLAIGWALANVLGPFALAGFAVAFAVARTVATTFARKGVSAGDTP